MQNIEQLEQIGDSATRIDGQGTVCFNIGNTFSSIPVLRTLKAGLQSEEAKLNDFGKTGILA